MPAVTVGGHRFKCVVFVTVVVAVVSSYRCDKRETVAEELQHSEAIPVVVPTRFTPDEFNHGDRFFL